MPDISIYIGKICPYCSKDTVFVDSEEVYGKSFGMIYLCRPCKSWVGVHAGTSISLGRLANAELRDYKKEAHFYFDQLWQEKMKVDNLKKNMARSKAYDWLSEELGIIKSDTHIAFFDVDLCKETINICKPLALKLNNVEYNGR